MSMLAIDSSFNRQIEITLSVQELLFLVPGLRV
jgi:hypothetical protein